MDFYYENIEAWEMGNFIDPTIKQETLIYYHAFEGYMYATDGRKAIRCKTKLINGMYKPGQSEAIHSGTHKDDKKGRDIAEQFDWINKIGVKVKTINLHKITLVASGGFSVVHLNIVDNIWFDFDLISHCFTDSGEKFTFHYTDFNKPIYVKEEVYEFVCMPTLHH